MDSKYKGDMFPKIFQKSYERIIDNPKKKASLKKWLKFSSSEETLSLIFTKSLTNKIYDSKQSKMQKIL